MAIMSHLSDCQEMVDMYGDKERIRMRINFVKAILCDDKPMNYEYTTQELDAIWEETKEMCSAESLTGRVDTEYHTDQI